MISIIWISLLAYTTFVRSEHISPSNAQGRRSIFILAGQSNMSGRGGVTNGTWDGYVPAECHSDPRILRLNAQLKWEEAQEPIHQDIDVKKTCGIGPGMAFANAVLERDASIGEIGLVPCAIGGTRINEWRRGSKLYKQMLARAQAAALLSDDGAIRAILWYQGESDTERPNDAKMYKMRLEKFFTDIRSDLQYPLLPIVQVALASGSGKYTENIRKAQLEIDLPNVRCVDAKGLPLERVHNLHLTTLAQVQLGEMMADAFFKIMASLVSVEINKPFTFNYFCTNFFLTCFR